MDNGKYCNHMKLSQIGHKLTNHVGYPVYQNYNHRKLCVLVRYTVYHCEMGVCGDMLTFRNKMRLQLFLVWSRGGRWTKQNTSKSKATLHYDDSSFYRGTPPAAHKKSPLSNRKYFYFQKKEKKRKRLQIN